MLTAGAAGTVSVNAQIIHIDLHIQIFLNIRHHITRNKGGLPFACRVKGRNPHQTVDSSLGLQIAEGIASVNLNGHGLDSRFISVQIIQHLCCKSMLICPSAVHPVKHAAPVAGLSSSGSGIQTQNGVAVIVLSRKEGRQAQIFQLLGKIIHHLLDLRDHGRIILLISHLDQKADLLVSRLKLPEALYRIL